VLDRRPPRRGGRAAILAWLLVGVLCAVGAFLLAREQATGGGVVDPPARGLPATPDYHSLLVDPANPNRLLLGTHVGVYESTNGGIAWRFAGLEGRDAMHFARDLDGNVWAAGHNVLERSEDGGRTWKAVRPDGLPGLDIHGFAVSPKVDGLVYAAVAGKGLYRSDDGGGSFRLISEDVGPRVSAIAIAKDGTLFAAEADRGVLVNANGDGVEWARRERARAAALPGARGRPLRPAHDPRRRLEGGPPAPSGCRPGGVRGERPARRVRRRLRPPPLPLRRRGRDVAGGRLTATPPSYDQG
jgi:hypothetical protein